MSSKLGVGEAIGAVALGLVGLAVAGASASVTSDQLRREREEEERRRKERRRELLSRDKEDLVDALMRPAPQAKYRIRLSTAPRSERELFETHEVVDKYGEVVLRGTLRSAQRFVDGRG